MGEDIRQAPERYFSRGQELLWLSFIVIGLALRWTGLEEKPYHLDEAQHAMFSKYFYDYPGTPFQAPAEGKELEGNFYRYDPVIHGPFLYNVYRLLYWTIQCGPWTARAPVALIGSVLLLVPFFFRRYFSRTAVIGLTAAIAVSPTLVHWSRFLRHDPFVWMAFLLMIYGVTLAQGGRKALFFLAGFSLHLCTMENYFVHGAIIAGYLVFEFFVKAFRRSDQPVLALQLVQYVRQNRRASAISLLIAIFIYLYFYSSGFRYWTGLKGPFAALEYWLGQHKQQRIDGPFMYHFHVLAWYELPFIFAFFVNIFLIYRQALKGIRMAGFYLGAAILLAGVYHWDVPVNEMRIWRFFKLKDLFDIAWLIFIVPHAVLVTLHHHLRGERALAFWGYFFCSMFFTYSYLGEKVPWLATYALLPGMIYLTLFFDRYFHENPLPAWREIRAGALLEVFGGLLMIVALIFCLEEMSIGTNAWFLGAGAVIFMAGFFEDYLKYLGTVNLAQALLLLLALYNVRAAIQTNFAYDGEAREFLAQVHTSREFHGLATELRQLIYKTPESHAPATLTNGETGWPLAWYMSELPRHRSDLKEYNVKEFNYIFDNFHDPAPEIPAGYRYEKITQRGWWWPDYENMTLKKFLNYSINHTPWNEPGYFYGSIMAQPSVLKSVPASQ